MYSFGLGESLDLLLRLLDHQVAIKKDLQEENAGFKLVECGCSPQAAMAQPVGNSLPSGDAGASWR